MPILNLGDNHVVNFHFISAVMAYPEDIEQQNIYVEKLKRNLVDDALKDTHKKVHRCIYSGHVLHHMKLLDDQNLHASVGKSIQMLFADSGDKFPWRLPKTNGMVKVPRTITHIRTAFWTPYKTVSHFGAAYVHLSGTGKKLSPETLPLFLGIAEKYLDFICNYIPMSQTVPIVNRDEMWWVMGNNSAVEKTDDFMLEPIDKEWLVSEEKEARFKAKIREAGVKE